MEEFSSCKKAMEHCISTETFSVAHLYKEEASMDMHIHDCYEIYYSISGGKQFLIDNRFYPIDPGDIFFINQYESHYLSQVDTMLHERIVLSIHPKYVQRLSTELTNLSLCFSSRNRENSHKVHLSKEQQTRFLYLVHKITSVSDFGHDVIEEATFMELLVLLNQIYFSDSETTEAHALRYNKQVDDILSYINQNITSDISIEQLASQFYLSESYICRIFKSATGTTINKYITARRISIAKSLLCSGTSVADTSTQCGFSDYSNFFKAFSKAVGISPKKYAQVHSC